MATNNLTHSGGAAVETGPDVTAVDVGVIGVTTPRGPSCPHETRAQGVDRWARPAMEDYAALVRDRTPLRAGCLPLARGGADTVAARLAALPARVSAVFIIEMSPSEAACVHQTVRLRRTDAARLAQRRVRAQRGEPDDCRGRRVCASTGAAHPARSDSARADRTIAGVGRGHRGSPGAG